MFVYQGQLKFHSWGQDETFVVVLPNGFARDGDTAYLFSQWTEDMQRRKKSNWFETVIVSGLTKNPSGGNDAFVLKGAYYTWQIETQDVYGKLNVKMLSPSNPSTTMTVERVWQSKGEQDTGNVRIWTGKFSWQDFSHDELVMFIAPDGLSDGKPILSIWQWTKDSKQKTKVGSFREGVQKAESGAGAGLYKFSWTSYYNITCTWNEKNETLAVHMKEGGLQQDVAQLNLFAKIERERPGHAHSFDAPLAAPQKAQLDVRLPQAQPSLKRLLNPLPFPGTLIETMEHTAAFLDQAGYLAKHAQDRYTALDVEYHVQLQLVEALRKENANLKDQIKTLNDALKVSNSKADELKKQLDAAKADAKNKEDELRKRIADLENHDIQDHQIVEDLRKQLKEALAKIAKLESELGALKVEKEALLAQIKALQGTVAALQAKQIELENALKVQKNLVDRLEKANDQLTKEKEALAKEKSALQKQLATVQDELSASQKELTKTKDELATSQREHKKTKAELDTTKTELATTKTELATTKTKLKSKEALLLERDNDIERLNTDIKKVTVSRKEAQANERIAQDKLREAENKLREAEDGQADAEEKEQNAQTWANKLERLLSDNDISFDKIA